MEVRTEGNDTVWTVIHSCPESRNAMDPDNAVALYEAFRIFDADESAHVAVFWGEGRAFFSGWDLNEVGRRSDFDREPPSHGNAVGARYPVAIHRAVPVGARLGRLYAIEKFGAAQADAYTAQLAALTTVIGPRARPCEVLMQGVRDASALTYDREGQIS